MEIVPASQMDSRSLEAAALQLVIEFGYAYPEWTPEQALAELMNPIGLPRSNVALQDGNVVGCASLLTDDEVTGFAAVSPWLGNVWVDPAHRHVGVGRALVSSIIELARSSGAADVHLVTDAGLRWYAAMGWRTVSTADVHGRTMHVMRLQLS